MKKSPSRKSIVIVSAVYVWIFRAWAPAAAAASTIASARSRDWLWFPDISVMVRGGWPEPIVRFAILNSLIFRTLSFPPR